MKLSVIIVNYNVCHYLAQCLRSVQASARGIETEIFVVDNASQDGSPQYLQPRFPDIHFIFNSRNVGFGRANNQAVHLAKGQYILFLNPDTLLTEDTLNESLAYAERQHNMGALGVRMLGDNGRFAPESRRGLPTPWTSFCKITGLTTLFPHSRRFGRYYMGYLDEMQPAEIEIVSGAFMLVRREALETAGLFDPTFFMYGEDIDLSYRLLKSGYVNHYYPTSILHYKGESTHRSTYRYVHVFYGAMLIFFRKHFQRSNLWLSPLINAAILIKAFSALVSFQFRQLHKFLWPRDEQRGLIYLYRGRHSGPLTEIAERHGLDIRNEGTITSRHIIFDASEHSYRQMIDYIDRSDHRTYLGIYYPDERLLVTGHGTYSADN